MKIALVNAMTVCESACRERALAYFVERESSLLRLVSLPRFPLIHARISG